MSPEYETHCGKKMMESSLMEEMADFLRTSIGLSTSGTKQKERVHSQFTVGTVPTTLHCRTKGHDKDRNGLRSNRRWDIKY